MENDVPTAGTRLAAIRPLGAPEPACMKHGDCSVSCPTCGGVCVRDPQSYTPSHSCASGHTW